MQSTCISYLWPGPRLVLRVGSPDCIQDITCSESPYHAVLTYFEGPHSVGLWKDDCVLTDWGNKQCTLTCCCRAGSTLQLLLA